MRSCVDVTSGTQIKCKKREDRHLLSSVPSSLPGHLGGEEGPHLVDVTSDTQIR
jgi:hypothetical protein